MILIEKYFKIFFKKYIFDTKEFYFKIFFKKYSSNGVC